MLSASALFRVPRVVSMMVKYDICLNIDGKQVETTDIEIWLASSGGFRQSPPRGLHPHAHAVRIHFRSNTHSLGFFQRRTNYQDSNHNINQKESHNFMFPATTHVRLTRSPMQIEPELVTVILRELRPRQGSLPHPAGL